MESPPSNCGGTAAPAAARGASAPELDAAAVPAAALADGGVSLYVHLPFCASKCRYCDFNSYAWTDQDLGRYVDAVLLEAAARAAGCAPQTVFLGGGTPSFLPAELLAELLDRLHAVTGFRDSAVEVTLEANPESFDDERAGAARAGGVNRVSIGVQSFRPEVLRAYDRAHDAEQALAAYARARTAGFSRINLDFIYAFPGQDPAAWEEDLHRALRLAPEHLSCYELSYEPGTALTRLRDAGRWKPEDPDLCRALFDRTRELCAAHGYGRYEVSNFARPGQACLHNLAYWRLLDYLGVGAGAVSWRHGERRRNLARPEDYQAAVEGRRDPAAEFERPAPRTVMFEMFMMGLRLSAEGVALGRVQARTGLDPRRILGAPLQRLIDSGLLEERSSRELGPCLRATDLGYPLLDSLLQELLDATPV